MFWGISSVGRAPALQAGGHEFDSRILHSSSGSCCVTIKYSSLAQSVEHAAVNRSVVGSSPTGGAKKTRKCLAFTSLSFHIHQADV